MHGRGRLCTGGWVAAMRHWAFRFTRHFHSFVHCRGNYPRLGRSGRRLASSGCYNLFSSVSDWMVLAAFCFLTRSTDSNDVDSVAFHLKTTWQLLQCREDAKILFLDIGDGLAMRADHVMVGLAVQLDP